MISSLTTAFPAKAGIQIDDSKLRVRVWVPAFAGNTERGLAGVGGS